MKKLLAVLLSVLLVVGLFAGCGSDEEAPETTAAATAAETPETEAAEVSYMEDLIAAAQAEGKLIVYGSCEEEYLAVACEKFQELYGIEVQYQRLSTGEVQSKVEEENGTPSADVWFGGTTDPYNVCAAEGCWRLTKRKMLPICLAMPTAMLTATGMAFTRAFWASWSMLTNWTVWVWKSPRTGLT